jgi:hypothetical protein
MLKSTSFLEKKNIYFFISFAQKQTKGVYFYTPFYFFLINSIIYLIVIKMAVQYTKQSKKISMFAIVNTNIVGKALIITIPPKMVSIIRIKLKIILLLQDA